MDTMLLFFGVGIWLKARVFAPPDIKATIQSRIIYLFIMNAAYDERRSMTLTCLDHYNVVESIENKYALADLPIKPFDKKGKTTSLTTAIQIIRDVPNLNFMNVNGNGNADLNRLAPPYGFAGRGLPPHSLQIYTKPQQGAGHTVISILTFDLRCNAKLLEEVFQGSIYILQMTKNIVQDLQLMFFTTWVLG